MQANELILEELLSRNEELEDLLEGVLDLFQTQPTGNSTFEGGMDLLDIEVSDEVEEFLSDITSALERDSLLEVEEV